MSYQAIRGIYEARIKQHLVAGGIPINRVYFDNVGETPGQADESYAVINFSFGQTIIDVITCGGVEDLNGSINVNIYTPRNVGSNPGELIALEVIKGWMVINEFKFVPTDPVQDSSSGSPPDHRSYFFVRVTNVTGPIPLAPDERPHYVTNISCRWQARLL